MFRQRGEPRTRGELARDVFASLPTMAPTTARRVSFNTPRLADAATAALEPLFERAEEECTFEVAM